MEPTHAEYGLTNAWDQAGERLRAIERWLDPGTTRVLAALGVRPGWRCWEIGAGAGSIARWLAGAVGPDGHVVASDLDPRLLSAEPGQALTVLEHDVVNDPPPDGRFDLVHCRLLLAHLPARQQVLLKMAGALKPGGCVVVEEMDFVAVATDGARDGGPALMEAAAASRSAIAIVAPAAAKRRAVASPMPVALPVMIAVWPERSKNPMKF